MRDASENNFLRYESMFLGATMFAFGFLKFFEPFHTWFHIQIAKSGLPPLSIPVGVAGEMAIGLGFLSASFLGRKIKGLFAPMVFLASAGLMVNMGVAVYVHLQPDVPAGVLPLGVKPPFIPLLFMLMAGGNLFQLSRTDRKGPAGPRSKAVAA